MWFHAKDSDNLSFAASNKRRGGNVFVHKRVQHDLVLYHAFPNLLHLKLECFSTYFQTKLHYFKTRRYISIKKSFSIHFV